jgi:hypothetical protein
LNSQQITDLAADIDKYAIVLRKEWHACKFIDIAVIDSIQNAIETLQHTLLEILEDLDADEDGMTLRKPTKKPPSPYDTLAEKAQALDKPHWAEEQQP